MELPSSVDVDRYPVEPLPQGPFTVGWIGSPISEKYLRPVIESLRYLQTNHGARIRMIGVSENFSLPGVAIERVPWREESEGSDLAACHVGIMPLDDGAWERGKCGYKLFQFMAAGRPVVASPVGINRSIVVPGQNGFLAETPQEWIDAFVTLAGDRDLASRLGLAGRRRVEELYSLRVNAPKVVEVLREAASSGAGARPQFRWD